MTGHPLGEVGAEQPRPQTATADVVEHVARDDSGHPLASMRGVDLRMGEHDDIALAVVVHEADEFAIDVSLLAVALRSIGHPHRHQLPPDPLVNGRNSTANDIRSTLSR